MLQLAKPVYPPHPKASNQLTTNHLPSSTVQRLPSFQRLWRLLGKDKSEAEAFITFQEEWETGHRHVNEDIPIA